LSGVETEGLRISRAADLEAQAAAWVRRQHFEGWAAEDQAALDTWLAESVGHQVAYWRICAGFESTERLTALRGSTQPNFGAEREEKLRPLTFRIVAGSAMTCVVIAAIGFVAAPKEKLYVTPIGGHEIVRLADGSQIELNTDTRLRSVTSVFGQRTVWLDSGEAFFNIEHDEDHPFVVRVAGHSLTDLGTKFVVRINESRVRVALMEGAIRLESDGTSKAQRATLVPGDVAVADAETLSIEKKSGPELQREESWRRGLLVFGRTTLQDATSEFNRYNTAKLGIEGGEVAHMQIGGTFNASDPALFARAASTMLGLHIVHRGNELIIAR
jgi:transmembrane sensor